MGTKMATFDATGDSKTLPSWSEIVEDYAEQVYRLAYRLTGNQHDAEDLTQDTFIRVFNALDSYKPGTFDAWLYRVTSNAFLDMVRKSNKYKFSDNTGLEDISGEDLTPGQIVDLQEFDPVLQAALVSLKPDFRVPLVLRDVEGLSYDEIATTLGIRLGTVRSRIHRARSLVKDYLLAHGYKDFPKTNYAVAKVIN